MIRLFHISDLHFGLEDKYALDWFMHCLHAEKPDAVIITGDLTMRARAREFEAACRWIEGLNVPVSVEVGNHDLPYFDPFARFFWPYRRIRRIRKWVENKIELDGIAIISLKTTARAQWRLDWSKGCVTGAALEKSLNQLDQLPPDTLALITAHHPLVEAGSNGKVLTRGGENALAELASRNVGAILTGHVHDPFDLVEETMAGPIRMIGAGTLSQRVRSTPPSFNEIRVSGQKLRVMIRTIDEVPSQDMRIDDIPPDAMPPRQPEEPVAPINAVPAIDPPIV